ncbi:MAG: hypothetical protein AAGC60_13370 [Acidobacteriota bacterium]
MMGWRRQLLWVDSLAGATVGVAMLVLAGWLAELFRVPQSLLLAMGVANLLYASCSGTLARRRRRPMALIVALAGANVAWALVCVTLALVWRGEASLFGLAHFSLEALFVGGLGWLEWRWREQLLERV